MKRDLGTFKIIIFDSDGVIIDSNYVKLGCFRKLTSLVGSDRDIERVSTLIRTSKGLTRYEIIDVIADIAYSRRGESATSYEWLLSKFSELVYSSLLECKIDEGIYKLREHHPAALWFVLTAGDEEETRRLYEEIGIVQLFKGGIYGSPESKKSNLQRILQNKSVIDKDDILIIGDSYSDAELAFEFGIAFALLTHWSDCPKAEEYCRSLNLTMSLDIGDLMQANRVNIAR